MKIEIEVSINDAPQLRKQIDSRQLREDLKKAIDSVICQHIALLNAPEISVKLHREITI